MNDATTNDQRRRTNGEPRTTNAGSADLLETIVAATRRVVAVRQAAEPIAALAARAEAMPSRGGRFEQALSRTAGINVAIAAIDSGAALSTLETMVRASQAEAVA